MAMEESVLLLLDLNSCLSISIINMPMYAIMSNMNSYIDWHKEKGAGHKNSGHGMSPDAEELLFLI